VIGEIKELKIGAGRLKHSGGHNGHKRLKQETTCFCEGYEHTHTAHTAHTIYTNTTQSGAKKKRMRTCCTIWKKNTLGTRPL